MAQLQYINTQCKVHVCIYNTTTLGNQKVETHIFNTKDVHYL
jgi:hypothetical protein